MSRFSELQAFVETAEQGSFTAAANSLNTTKSAISRRVSQLEDRLKTQLLRRSSRKLSLTDTGEELRKKGAAVLAELAAIEQDVLRPKQGLEGTLRLSVHPALYTTIVNAAKEFRDLHPGVTFRFSTSATAQASTGPSWDLCCHLGEPEDSSLLTKVLDRTCFRLCCSRKLYAEHRLESADQLSNVPCIVGSHTQRLTTWSFATDDEEEETVQVNPVFQALRGASTLEATKASVGFSLELQDAIIDDLERGDLMEPLPHCRWEETVVRLLYHPDRYRPAHLVALIDHLVDAYS